MIKMQTRKARGLDGPYSLNKPEEFSAALSEGVKAISTALSGALSSFYAVAAGQTQAEHQRFRRSETHIFVLTRIFKDVPNLGNDQMGQLDEVLTHHTQLLKPYGNGCGSGQETLAFCVILRYINVMDITGSGDAIVIQPYTRMANVSLKAQEWTRALAKPGFLKRNVMIDFSMTTTTTDFKFDEDRYQGMKGKFTSMIEQMCDNIPKVQGDS